MSKHTPGPWKATFKTVSAPETDDRLGFECRIFTGNGDDARANSRLIASAPELLAACQLFVEYEKSVVYDDGMLAYNEVHEAIRAAIAKATGAKA